MMTDEITYELSLPYDELVVYLQKKYGYPKGDYFLTSSCRSRNRKISRTTEGLLIHHIGEDRILNLNQPDIAIHYPYDYQKMSNLVYVNMIEHLILHIKILIQRQQGCFYKKADCFSFFSDGIFLLAREINTMFMENGTATQWRQNCFSVIRDNKEEYLALLQTLMSFLDMLYYGDDKTKPAILSVGSYFTLEEKVYFILKVDHDHDIVYFQGEDGPIRYCPIIYFREYFSFSDVITVLSHSFSITYSGYSNEVFSALLEYHPLNELKKEWLNSLKKDFCLPKKELIMGL